LDQPQVVQDFIRHPHGFWVFAAMDVCGEAPLVSVIVPCHNAERFIQECLRSVVTQTYRPLELSLWDDASRDSSALLVQGLKAPLEAAGVRVVLGSSGSSDPAGCGAAKNRAVAQSHGAYLCFLDADDVMRHDRVAAQLELAMQVGAGALVGSNVERDPADAQPRYTAWLNGLTESQLVLQRFRECTLAMPTWFCHRDVFKGCDGFSEAGPGTPEDLDFLYRHLHRGGQLTKVMQPLVLYRYHEQQQSHGVSKDSIWALRVAELELGLLNDLSSFSIWSAGRDGKRLYRSLTSSNRAKVVAFLDVDTKKLGGGGYYDRERSVHVPVMDWTCAVEPRFQPTIVCVKGDLHAGFEDNLASLGLEEGRTFWHFN